MFKVSGLARNDIGDCSIGPFDLTLDAGSIAVLSGPSGVGKTLFLRALADLDPAEGIVSLNDVISTWVPAPKWRKLVGYLAPEPGWWTDRVGDHFEAETDISGLLATLDLGPDCMDWSVQRLSTGERQRLGLVRILAAAPEVLLLDEPTSALDSKRTVAVESLLRDLASEGRIILMTSHDDEQAKRLGARQLVMSKSGLKDAGS